MSFPSRRHGSQDQRGLGLVEIMISLVIGLVVLAALSYLLIGGRQTSKTQDDMSRMQESGRFALEVIGKAIRQSGYRLDITKPFNGKSIEGTDGEGDVEGADATPDTITLRHDPAWIRHPQNAFQGEEANCAGGIITSDNALDPKTGIRLANAKLIVATFSIDKGELRCTTVGPNGKPTSAIIVSQIENLQIEYGIDAAGDGNISSYERADAVEDFSRVASVRVNLLVKGATPNIAVGQTQAFTFNGESKTVSDGFLRQVYTATFAVRNFSR